ncbi:ATP-dependent Clp protease proteolytic subunit [Bacillus thuringiensis serovar tolworthi]|uniref:ATP-dependent Clp protease proteolytic subunit n=3 Tax=Bacillus cereus group TaxID=86661 RepID=A0A9W3ZSI3_BACTO|nr:MULTISPECIES: head maturation protease, ClpP-related [Bacillus cereus group]MEB8712953.1 Clp protease ClpP [Bacillus cereus]MRC49304.1 Clp protease ClpP [Bacillus thuringiensis]MEB9594840.1 Clp protease ClpP [Bacillus cereus]MRD27637.1 Clp protease ClpP [Bacillus thuringiensis]BAR81503.1 ATP-dependent Clp protease proteolytic subunit [Bacillus thuringiensis serovar tolworthi]
MQMEKIQPKFLMMDSKGESEDKKVVAYMHGVVGSGWWGDITAKKTREMFDKIEADEIELHINSGGGDAFEGVAICNYLRNHSSKITVVVDGLCASAASVIAMGADKVIMPSNTTMMVHRAATYAFGNADSLEKQAKKLRDVDASLIQSYKNRFNGEFFELEELLDNETYMTAEAAKSYGLCDEIIDAVANSVDGESNENVIEEPEPTDSADVAVKNEANKRAQNAERSMQFMNSLLKSIKKSEVIQNG